MHRRVLAMAAAAAVVVVLTACEPDLVGTAASAGDDRLSVSGLQERSSDVAEARNAAIESHGLSLPPVDVAGDLSTIQQDVLERWITYRVFDQIAADQDIEVTEADIDNFLDEFRSQLPEGDLTPFLAEQGLTRKTLREEARAALISNQLSSENGDEVQQAMTAAAEELDVEVNPRYGTWDGGAFVAESGSVSEPFGEDPAAGGPLEQ